MSDPTRVPSLAIPFAVVGGAAGWLSADFLCNPLVAVSASGGKGPATVVGSAVAGGIGAALSRWCAARTDRERAWKTWLRLVSTVVLGGGLVGGVVTAFVDATVRYVHVGVGVGVLASLAFVPVCAVVMAAAKRADRARLGSLVAGSDRRAVWAILVSALSVTAGAVAIDWPLTDVADRYGHVPPPWVAVAILVGALVVLAASVRADWAALLRVKTVAASTEVEEYNVDVASPDLPRVDLGLGDGVRALIARGAVTYRSRDRTMALVVGSPDDAAVALRRAVRRDALGLAVTVAVLGAHAVAACAIGCTLPDRPPFQSMRCTTSTVWDPVPVRTARP